MTGSLLRGVLALVAAMDGKLESRIRFQKSAYLLKRVGVLDFAPAYFKYHHYGPYSRELSDVLQQSVASGLLREEREDLRDGQSKYTYELTASGRRWLEEGSEANDPRVLRFGKLFQIATWRSLELAATALYVEREERVSERAEAIDRALRLKPQCAEFRSEAEELLRQLSV
jgi:uncharacterized protein YwgA